MGEARTTSDEGLEGRIRRLERENRRMRWIFAVLVVALLAACAKEEPPPSTVVATEFKVVDENGNVYARLGQAPWGPEGGLILYDQSNDDRRTSLGPADLVLATSGSTVHVQAGKVSMLEMHDDNGWTGAKLSSHPNKRESSLWLSKGKGSIFASP
jgi:hypothetical protein